MIRNLSALLFAGIFTAACLLVTKTWGDVTCEKCRCTVHVNHSTTCPLCGVRLEYRGNSNANPPPTVRTLQPTNPTTEFKKYYPSPPSEKPGGNWHFHSQKETLVTADIEGRAIVGGKSAIEIFRSPQGIVVEVILPDGGTRYLGRELDKISEHAICLREKIEPDCYWKVFEGGVYRGGSRPGHYGYRYIQFYFENDGEKLWIIQNELGQLKLAKKTGSQKSFVGRIETWDDYNWGK